MFRQRRYKWIKADLSEDFDCILHDILLAELAVCLWFSIPVCFLSKRQPRTKINNVFSRFSEITYRVPQGSILGLSHFSIYICDIFLT